jgi:hypothetical protein
MVWQSGKEAHMEVVEGVAAVGGQAKGNYVVLHTIEEELNAHMTTMTIHNRETRSHICTISVSFFSCM